MAEYIEWESFRENLAVDKYGCTDIVKINTAIEKSIAADVAPVRHGRWVLLDECSNEGVYCSACNKKVYKACYANQKIKSKFCPNCGARMGKEENRVETD